MILLSVLFFIKWQQKVKDYANKELKLDNSLLTPQQTFRLTHKEILWGK